jgi:pimeloyl-ACP methyl ester carboxylesterase
MDLRGYGWSAGSPSEEGWRKDATAAFDHLVGRGIAPERIVVHGVSIGTGPAMWLAERRELSGLILQSPFTSLASVAQRTFFFVPCRLLLRDRYDNLAAAPAITDPVLIIHGTADGIVAPGHSERLAAAFPDPVRRVTAPGYGHNDLSYWDEYWPTITGFVDGLAR